MRNGSAVFNNANFQTNRLQGANGGFTARSGPFDADFDFTHAVRHGLAGSVLRHLLSAERCAFPLTFESNTSGRRPTKKIALHVRNSDLGVVKSGQNVRNADGDVFRAFGFDDLFGIRVFAQQFRSSGSGHSSDRFRRFGCFGPFSFGRSAFGGSLTFRCCFPFGSAFAGFRFATFGRSIARLFGRLRFFGRFFGFGFVRHKKV